MKKTYSYFIIIIIIIILVSAILFIQKEKTIENKEVNIGAILFLSGDLSDLGKETLNSFLIAKEELEKENNIKINLEVEDNQSTATQAVMAYSKLNLKGYPLIISVGDAMNQELLPIASSTKTLLFTILTGSHDTNGEWMMRGWFNSRQQGSTLANYVSSTDSKTIGILKLNNPFSISLIDVFKENLREDINIVSEQTYNIADFDTKVQLMKLKEENPDFILVTGFGPTYPIIFKQARELDLNIPIIADDVIGIPYYFNSAGGYDVLNNVYYFATGFDNVDNIKSQEFITKYNTKYNTEPSFISAFAYDSFNAIVKVMLICDTKDSSKLKECFYNYEEKGLLGDIKFNSDGDIDVPIYIKQYYNNQNIIIKKYSD